jgi:hypothetical protein
MVAWSPTRYAITSATRSGAHGADAFAERARRELLATGEKVRKREVDPATSSPRRRSTSCR